MSDLPLSRRMLLHGLTAAGVLALLPWRRAVATPSEAEQAQTALIGARPVRSGVLRLTAPTLAENGATVPVSVALAGSLPPGITVDSFHLLSEGNPLPLIASFQFSPFSVPFAKLRIRLAKTQTLRALALLSDGTVYGTEALVKVTIGGCGG